MTRERLRSIGKLFRNQKTQGLARKSPENKLIEAWQAGRFKIQQDTNLGRSESLIVLDMKIFKKIAEFGADPLLNSEKIDVLARRV
jgi:hypothetical protein